MNDPLLKEIAVALGVKLAAIVALWYLFFSQPLDRNLDVSAVSRAVIGPGAVSVNASSKEPHADDH